jgi:Fe-S oxidoreductase
MTFNLFVLPFSIGLIYVLFAIGIRFSRWIKALNAEDKYKFFKGLRSAALFSALKEVFMESLLHRKMFKKNALLGYMHMSFALGWLLLIIGGNMESRIYSGFYINPPYYPIFLKFFIHDKRVLPFEIFTVPGFFRFTMDLFLVFVLSGVALALFKRSKSKFFGIKKSAHLQLTDKVAMTCLWLIFPFRLLAECYTVGFYGGGGFITQHLGNFLVSVTPLPAPVIAYGFWWSYSFVLGIFFVMLPYTRFMHIFAEVLLIFFRNFGIKTKVNYSSVSDVEVHSCSRCGVCIDVCQFSMATEASHMQSVYFIRAVRDQHVREKPALQCMICGRCQDACPVGVHIDDLRLLKRKETYGKHLADFSYLPRPVSLNQQAEVVYFAGCMTHLTPLTHRAMTSILEKAGINYIFLDKEGSVCCGRPMMLAGKRAQAEEMIRHNKELIMATKARTLVTSCPICHRIFKEEYNLPIRIVHHSQYLLELVKQGRLPLQSYHHSVVYHDPCELGRHAGVYSEPRELISKVADLIPASREKEDALCCGGSLGTFTASEEERSAITINALESLLANTPDYLVTSCPACKKTFSRFSEVQVVDIAEIIDDAIPGQISRGQIITEIKDKVTTLQD